MLQSTTSDNVETEILCGKRLGAAKYTGTVMSLGERDIEQFVRSFAKLLPDGFEAAACPITTVEPQQALQPEEWAQAHQFRPKRRQEFAAGRVAARRALAQLGHEPVALPIGYGRAPVWPPGLIGSISHAHEIALAAAGPDSCIAALGIDIERQNALSDELAILIITPGDSPVADPTLLFSIKESAFKCLFRSVGRVIDYTETRVAIAAEAGTFVLAPSTQATTSFAKVHGYFDMAHGYWRACCILEQSE